MGTTIKKGVVFDIKKYAVDDGPGIRTTVFLKGCPLRCWWCQNPEGQALAPELAYKSRRCIGCGECIEACPRDAISCFGQQIRMNRERCDLCGKCSLKCPTEALAMVGEEVSVERIIQEIEKDVIFYEESGGGITFSGGEPLLQSEFLDALLEQCKDRNIHTAVDTSGYASFKTIDKISDKVSLFLYDIKMIDDKKHRRYTGASNKPILENFKRLVENGSNILVRFPIVPGINDDKDNITKTAEFIISHGIKHINLLPYHRAGIEKYKSLSKAYNLEKTQPPSDQKQKSIKEELEAFGLTVKIGGI